MNGTEKKVKKDKAAGPKFKSKKVAFKAKDLPQDKQGKKQAAKMKAQAARIHKMQHAKKHDQMIKAVAARVYVGFDLTSGLVFFYAAISKTSLASLVGSVASISVPSFLGKIGVEGFA